MRQRSTVRPTTVRHSLISDPSALHAILFCPPAELFKNSSSDGESKPKVLYLGLSSDGGLCGGIHSSITRLIKKEMVETQGQLAVVGDKPKAQLSRAMPGMFKVSFSGVGKDVPTFAEASVIADEIVKNGGEWDEVIAYPDKYGDSTDFHSVTDSIKPLSFRHIVRGQNNGRHLRKGTARLGGFQAIRDGG